jgi:hypothetical protein
MGKKLQNKILFFHCPGWSWTWAQVTCSVLLDVLGYGLEDGLFKYNVCCFMQYECRMSFWNGFNILDIVQL